MNTGEFGNFLLGAMRGLGEGAEAGEAIGAAIDRKKQRDVAKKVTAHHKASDQMAASMGGYDRVGPAASPMKAPISPAPVDPSKVAAPTAMQANMPSQAQQAGQLIAERNARAPVPAPAAAAAPAPIAASMGVEAPTFNSQFSSAIPANFGVMGGYRNPYMPDEQQLPY